MSKKYYLLIFSLCALILAFFIFKLFNNQGVGTNESFKWKIYSVYTDINPIYKKGMEKFIDDVKTMTGGQIAIEYIPFGAEGNKDRKKIFNAVADGTMEMGFGTPFYWNEGKIPGSMFLYAIPFGLNSRDMYDWLIMKGGLKLCQDKIFKPLKVVPFPIGDTGGAMGGWFEKKIEDIIDKDTGNFNGLHIRERGLPGEVWKKLGAIPHDIVGDETRKAYDDKLINAIVCLGPYADQNYKFNKVLKYYYYPGWQEPCGLLSLIINKKKWDQLPENFKKIIEMACISTYYYMLDLFNINNSTALLNLQKDGIKIMEFSSVILDKFRELTGEVLEEEAKKNTQLTEIYQSFNDFKNNKPNFAWDKIVEEAVYYETTVLNFIKDVSNYTVASVYKKGNKKVVISLSGDISKEISGIAKIINDYSISIRYIMVEGPSENREKAKKIAGILDDGTNKSLTKKIFYGDMAQIGAEKSTDKVEIVIEF